MIENGVKVFPKLMFSLEIKSLILNCGGSIYSKKCKAVRSCVQDKDYNSGIPGMEVVDNWKERSGDSKTHSSMRIICGSGEI